MGRMTAVRKVFIPGLLCFPLNSCLYTLWEKQLPDQHGSLDLSNLSVVYKHPREQMCTYSLCDLRTGSGVGLGECLVPKNRQTGQAQGRP